MENVWVLTSRYSDGSDGLGDLIRVYEREEDGLEALEVAQTAGASLVKTVELTPVPFVKRY